MGVAVLVGGTGDGVTVGGTAVAVIVGGTGVGVRLRDEIMLQPLKINKIETTLMINTNLSLNIFFSFRSKFITQKIQILFQ